jgi:hydrogenase expression/formation protein HypC
MCLAIPGKIVELADCLPGGAVLGTVEVAGVRRKVDLGLLKDDMPRTGDWVLIHVGFAMTKISELDALEQMQLLTMLGETEQAMQEVRGYGLEDGAEVKDMYTKPN